LLGGEGLARLAALNHSAALALEARLAAAGIRVLSPGYVNEFAVHLGDETDAASVVDRLAGRGILGGVPASRFYPQYPELRPVLLLAATETNTEEDMDLLVAALTEEIRR
jgi:glycine dehydrogenase subunit 1